MLPFLHFESTPMKKKNTFTRRTFLHQLATSSLLLLPEQAQATPAAPAQSSIPFLKGINAYYLLVEAYRYVKQNAARGKRRELVYEYLTRQLQLPDIQEECGFNAIRFWAFNDYPDMEGIALPGATDARLWLGKDKAEPEAFEILAHLFEFLEHFGLYMVPCLANYWSSYGGILQYLAWAGTINEETYINAVCENKTDELYLHNTLRFFTSAEVENIFRKHTGRVISLLAGARSVAIIDIMNEPRGKNPYSLKDKALPDGRKSSEIVAQWFNRQARWARSFFKFPGQQPFFSTGEDGWLEQPVNYKPCTYLCKQGQYYEGIDLTKNLSFQPPGINIGSIHLYPHRIAQLQETNICGRSFIDRRGWEHLMPATFQHDKKQFAALSMEWIRTRAAVLKGKPWYIGEMGWCWPVSSDRKPASAQTLAKERHYLYTRWTDQAKKLGARGVFLWMLNGHDHRDAFYGLNRRELFSVITGRNL